jgi:hypothetical protein
VEPEDEQVHQRHQAEGLGQQQPGQDEVEAEAEDLVRAEGGKGQDEAAQGTAA